MGAAASSIPHLASFVNPPRVGYAVADMAEKNPFEVSTLEQNEQSLDIVAAKEVPGFEGLRVGYTLEKKNASKKKQLPNGDAVLADAKTGLVGVFDGVGSNPRGHEASAYLAEKLPAATLRALEKDRKRDDEDVMQELRQRLRDSADERIALLPLEDSDVALADLERKLDQTVALVTHDPEIARHTEALLQGMERLSDELRTRQAQTTACVGFVHQTPDGRQFLIAANVGDSGCIVIRKDGSVLQVTTEDSYVNMLLASGDLTPELLLEMKQNPTAKVALPVEDDHGTIVKEPMDYYWVSACAMRFMGSKICRPTIGVTELFPGDTALFLTDGALDKYDRSPDKESDPDEMAMYPIDLQHIGDTYRGEDTLEDRLNALRVESKFMHAYKSDDDFGAAAIEVVNGDDEDVPSRKTDPSDPPPEGLARSSEAK
jgi:serine/threonine protein phosphatase PrpC